MIERGYEGFVAKDDAVMRRAMKYVGGAGIFVAVMVFLAVGVTVLTWAMGIVVNLLGGPEVIRGILIGWPRATWPSTGDGAGREIDHIGAWAPFSGR
jgi:hypothetical protein